jgi:hypothetical protein
MQPATGSLATATGQTTTSVNPLPEPQAIDGFFEGATSEYTFGFILAWPAILIIAGAAIYWSFKHPHEVFEVIGNIVAVAIFIGIGYLILHYIIRYG